MKHEHKTCLPLAQGFNKNYLVAYVFVNNEDEDKQNIKTERGCCGSIE
jgi:hypothetical protein